MPPRPKKGRPSLPTLQDLEDLSGQQAPVDDLATRDGHLVAIFHKASALDKIRAAYGNKQLWDTQTKLDALNNANIEAHDDLNNAFNAFINRREPQSIQVSKDTMCQARDTLGLLYHNGTLATEQADEMTDQTQETWTDDLASIREELFSVPVGLSLQCSASWLKESAPDVERWLPGRDTAQGQGLHAAAELVREVNDGRMLDAPQQHMARAALQEHTSYEEHQRSDSFLNLEGHQYDLQDVDEWESLFPDEGQGCAADELEDIHKRAHDQDWISIRTGSDKYHKFPRAVFGSVVFANHLHDYEQVTSSISFEKPVDMVTLPKKYQITGAAKLQAMINGPYRGGICGDDMGLGKTLCVILALRRKPGEPYEGPVLVLCPKSIITNWVQQLKYHFKPEYQQRVLVIGKDQDIGPEEIFAQRIDFVVCTYDFVWNRGDAVDYAAEFNTLIYLGGVKQARRLQLKPPYIPHRAKNPMDPETWRAAGLEWRALVLDEAHALKNHKAVKHIAVRELPVRAVVPVTGTPYPNRWHDAFGLVNLLPVSIFDSFEHFVKTFGTIDTSGKVPCKFPDHRRLAAFLNGISFSRPASAMGLKSIAVREVDVPLSGDIIFEIDDLTERFLKLAVMDDDTSPIDSGNAAAFSKVVEASMVAVAPILRLPQPQFPTRADLDEYNRNDQALKEKSKKRLLQYIKSLGHDSIDDLKPQELQTYILGRHQKSKAQTAVDGDDQDEDPDYHPDKPASNDDDVVEYEISDGCVSGRRSSKREDWLTRLRNTNPTEYAFQPRLFLVERLIEEAILGRDPKAKIIVFSRYLRVLDVLERTIKFHTKSKPVGSQLNILRFDGSISTDQRDMVVTDFQSTDGPTVLLITAGAGGQGITLTAGTHVILCEPWWTVAEENQAIGRAQRTGQLKQVNVWKVSSPMSTMEMVIRHVSAYKQQVKNALDEALKRNDEDEDVVVWDLKRMGTGLAKYQDFMMG